jgi:hypothetical protein
VQPSATALLRDVRERTAGDLHQLGARAWKHCVREPLDLTSFGWPAGQRGTATPTRSGRDHRVRDHGLRDRASWPGH